MNEQHAYQDDEIDLFDLFDDIKARWLWVLSTLLLMLVLAVGYVFTATPTFKAKTELMAVSEQDLTAINLAKARLDKVSDLSDYERVQFESTQHKDKAFKQKLFNPLVGADLFANYTQLLNSPIQKIEFYQQLLKYKKQPDLMLIYNPALSQEENNDNFLQRFSSQFESIKNSKQVKMVLTIETPSADFSARLLNQYVEFVRTKYLASYRHVFKYELTNTLNSIKNMQKSALNNYKFKKYKRIVLLKEAIAIAARIGQKKPFYNLNKVVTANEPPLYMMGELALKEELNQLQERGSKGQDETVYIEGFSILNEKQVLLEDIYINWSEIKLVQVNSYATPPKSAYKPKKLLIIAIAGVAGLMLGVMLALLVAASSRRAQAKLEAKHKK